MNEQPWYLNLFNQELIKDTENSQTIPEELKSCPFCGGKSILVPLASCHGYIACIGDCGFRSADFWDEPMNEEKQNRTGWKAIATEAWNKRYDKPEE